MSDVGGTLMQLATGVAGAWWWYADHVKKIDARRAESWASWVRRPLRDPPPRTDWDAFELRVAGELATEAARAEAAEFEALIDGGRAGVVGGRRR